MLIKVNIYDPTNAKYLAAMFRGRGVPESVEVDDAELAEARNHAEEQHPEESPEQIYARATARLAWKKYKTTPLPAAPSVTESPSLPVVPPPPLPVVAAKFDWKDAAWKIAVLVLLLLIAIRGHAQIDVIKVQDNAGAAVGTIASPFTFKAGANCSWAKSASTYTFNCSGGAAGAGGSSGQVQWNSTGSLAGISSLTTDGTINTALAGADWLFADLTTPTKKFQFDASNISAATTRTMNVPDANATFAQAISAVSHKFITQMSAQGLFTLAQPACADISDAGVFCSGTAYSSLTGTPTLPANTTATASNFFTAYNSTTGAFTKAQPAYSDISGTLALASAVFANQGSTTTVLHGNAAGNPSFASVTTSDLSSTTGNGTKVATGTGTYTSGNCVKIDANGNLIDNGSVCGGGGGSTILDHQAATSALVGDGTDKTIWTYSMPSGTLTAGQCVHLHWTHHASAAGGPAYKVFFGATSVNYSNTTATTQVAQEWYVCNNAGSTTAQTMQSFMTFSNGSVQQPQSVAAAENTNSGSAIIIKITFNVSAGTSVTGDFELIELVK